MNDFDKFFNNYTTKQIDVELLNACEAGDLAKVEYLLTSPNLIRIADIHISNDLITNLVCSHNHIELMKFLVSSPKIKDHINIHAYKDKLFTTAFVYKRLEMIEYLIFDCGISKNKNIKHFFSVIDDSQANAQIDFKITVEKLFAKRELEKSLRKDLNINNKKHKLNKI
jgi:hypothetical protein